MQENFAYFSDIEEHFCRRRGTALICSTLDWSLMEVWKDAGIPLAAVLRGIDATFARYDARPSKTRKINALAYCAQEVLAAAEEMKEAAVGATHTPKPESGFEQQLVAAYLEGNAEALERLATNTSSNSSPLPAAARQLAEEASGTLRALATGLRGTTAASLEDLERRLTVLEEKLMAALLAGTPDEQVVAARADADRELAPYRRKMTGPQIEQLVKQYVHKRLLEKYAVPRLSLFYM